MTAETNRYRYELALDVDLVDRILREFPAVVPEPRRIIRASSEHADRAVARAIAHAAVRLELWNVEIVSR